VEKHLEMAVEVIHERIRLDQQRVSPDAAEVLRVIDAKLLDPRFKAGSLSPSKKVRESFREVFRATLNLYVRVRRIEVALFLLDYTEATIPAIAKAVGYPNTFSFNYTFDKLMGRSPTAERRHWRSQNRGAHVSGPRLMVDGRPLTSPLLYEAPIDRRCLVGALEPHSAAFHLCHLRWRASDDDNELGWLGSRMDAYLEEVRGDPRAVPEVPDLRARTETLDMAEAFELLERAARPTLDVLDAYEVSVPRSLRSMVDHLRANVTTPEYRLDQLQDEVGAYHADRSEFSHYMGITPRQYLFEARMETASRLLRDTPLSVTVIAELVGYADPPQFRRAFKTWSGALAPDEYRTRVRHVASRVGPAPARFINWRYLEHVRGPAPKEALEWVRYVESVYSFVSPIHVDDRSSPPAPLEGRDRQLDKAIELVTERIEAEPRHLPERPPGPIKTQ
jgi:AraC-like DNA-binding protein